MHETPLLPTPTHRFAIFEEKGRLGMAAADAVVAGIASSLSGQAKGPCLRVSLVPAFSAEL
jgi:hypothetical protein